MPDYAKINRELFYITTKVLKHLHGAQINTEEIDISSEYPRIFLLKSKTDGGKNGEPKLKKGHRNTL